LDQPGVLADLHRLGAPLCARLIKQPARMGLDGVLAHIKLPGDLAVAHVLGYQFKDLQLTARDAEILSFSLVRDERFGSRDSRIRPVNPPRLSTPVLTVAVSFSWWSVDAEFWWISPQSFQSNVSPIREGGCTARFRVSDTRCGTYLI
jgi:hypothetical protein